MNNPIEMNVGHQNGIEGIIYIIIGVLFWLTDQISRATLDENWSVRDFCLDHKSY